MSIFRCILSFRMLGDDDAVFALSEPFCSRIVRLRGLNFEKCIHLNGQQFSSITSLGLETLLPMSAPQVRTLFPALSQLPQLAHLHLSVSLSYLNSNLPRPLTQLSSVRAFDLDLSIDYHPQVEWLNLQWTLPNCQAIYLAYYYCHQCRVCITDYLGHKSSTEKNVVECLRATLSKLHAGVSANRIVLHYRKPYRTAQEVFACSQ